MRDSRVWDGWIGPEIHFQIFGVNFPSSNSNSYCVDFEQRTKVFVDASFLIAQLSTSNQCRLETFAMMNIYSEGKFMQISFCFFYFIEMKTMGENSGRRKFLVSLPKQFLDIKFNKGEILAYRKFRYCRRLRDSQTGNKFIESICFNVYRLSRAK